MKTTKTTPSLSVSLTRAMSSFVGLCLAILVWLGAVAPADAFTMNDRLYLANKMLTLPPSASVPGNGTYYWYTVPCRPWNWNGDPTTSDQGYSSRPTVWISNPAAPDMVVQGYIEEINQAKAYGFDGFIVDITSTNPADVTTWQKFIQAAEICGDFYLALQPDLTTGTNPQNLKPFLDATSTSPAYLHLNGLPLVVPYCAGYGGAASEKSAWTDWYASQGLPIAYMPSVFLDIAPYTNNDMSFKDPTTGYPAFAGGITSFSPYRDDSYRKSGIDYWQNSLPVCMDMSFQYQNIQVWYLYNHGSANFRNSFQLAVDNRNNGVQWVQPECYNDFGESAFCPNENIFMALAPISAYYAEWFKSGVKPYISKDQVSIFHKAYPHAATVSRYPKYGDIGGSDEVEAVALMSAAGTLYIQSGTNTYSTPVVAGINALTEPCSLGIQKAWTVRGTTTTATVTSPVPFHNDPIRNNVWTLGYTSAYPPESMPLTPWTTTTGTITASGTTATGTGTALVGEGDTMLDYRITAKVKPASAAIGVNCGVIAYAQPPWGYYSLSIGNYAGTPGWHLSQWDGTTENVLLSGSTTFAANVTRTLRLDKVGDYLIAYIDGVQVGHTADWGPTYMAYTDGRFGFGQAGVSSVGASTAFSSILVERYQPNMSNIAAKVTFSPPGGLYTAGQTVTLSCATPGVTIRYSTSGNDPSSTAGTVYTGPISITSTKTLKAVAYQTGMLTSYVKGDDYVITTTPTVATPTLSAAAGTYAGSKKVTLSCSTAGATIRYTLDGTTPTELVGYAVASGGFAIVDKSETIKAVAYRKYMTDSAIKTAAYTITPSTGWTQVGVTDPNGYTTAQVPTAGTVFAGLGTIPSNFAITGGVLPNMKVTYSLYLFGMPNWGPQTCGRQGLVLYSPATPVDTNGLFSGVNDWNYQTFGALAGDIAAPLRPMGYNFLWDNTVTNGNPDSFNFTVEVLNGVMTTTMVTVSPPGIPTVVKSYIPTAADIAAWTGNMNYAAFRAGPAGNPNFEYSAVTVGYINFYSHP